MEIVKKEEEEKLMKEAGVELYKALRMLLGATTNREAIVAVEAAKMAIAKAEGASNTN